MSNPAHIVKLKPLFTFHELTILSIVRHPPPIILRVETRVAIDIFGLQIYWYGILLTIGMMLAVHLAAMELKRLGVAPQVMWDGALIILGLGILGGRLYHAFSEYNDGTLGWSYYRNHPLEIITGIRDGGLGIYGGVVAGGLGALYVALRNRVRPGIMADCLAPALPLGQAIGRWGNYANQELYGPPTGSSWWGITIAPWARVPPYNNLDQYPLDLHFHPTFLYESIYSFIGVILMLWIGRKFSDKLHTGDLFGLYMIYYGIGRGLLESTVRLDAATYGTGPLPTAVLFSLAFIAGGIVILVGNRLFKTKMQLQV